MCLVVGYKDRLGGVGGGGTGREGSEGEKHDLTKRSDEGGDNVEQAPSPRL